MKLKIVSGGQTGADRAALDVAIKLNIAHGGWCPKGRKAIDGTIAKKYQLKEMPSASYVARTKQNVIDSDGTVIFYIVKATGGTKKTINFCKELNKDHLELDLSEAFLTNCLCFSRWFENISQKVKSEIFTLNIAGPRQSDLNNIYRLVFEILENVLAKIKNTPQ